MSAIDPFPIEGKFSEEIASNIIVDNRYSAYVSFFDHDWAKNVFVLSDGTKLESSIFDLCTSWKSVANAFRLPWLMFHMMEHFHRGWAQNGDAASQKLIGAVQTYLITSNQFDLSRMKRREIASKFESIADKVRNEMAITRILPAEEMWNEIFPEAEFHLSLWSLQRLSFSDLVHAYEAFLARCVAVATANPAYRAYRIGDLKDDLDRILGAGTGDECYGDDIVDVARQVRNAIAHDGGRATPELRNRANKFVISDDGRIHVMPENIKELFECLKHKIERLLKKAVVLPEFKM